MKAIISTGFCNIYFMYVTFWKVTDSVAFHQVLKHVKSSSKFNWCCDVNIFLLVYQCFTVLIQCYFLPAKLPLPQLISVIAFEVAVRGE